MKKSLKTINNNILAFRSALESLDEGTNLNINIENFTGFGASKEMLFILQPELNSKVLEDTDLLHLFVDLTTLLEKYEGNENLKKLGIDYSTEKVLKELIASLSTQFYTPHYFLDKVFSQVAEQNLTINSFLDPSAGSGRYIEHFLEKFPNCPKVVGYEIDTITAIILKAKYLHLPQVDIRNSGFQQHKTTEKFDLIASNIPFSNQSVWDLHNPNQGFNQTLHGYFFAKGEESLNENGVLSFLCPSGILHTEDHKELRHHLLQNSSLIHALQLPNHFYETTEVNSALISLVKSTKLKDIGLEQSFLSPIQTIVLKDDKGSGNFYFNPHFVANVEYHLPSPFVLAPSIDVSRRPYGRLNYWYNPYTDKADFIQHLDRVLNFNRLANQDVLIQLEPVYEVNQIELEHPVPIFSIPQQPVFQIDLFDSTPFGSYDLLKAAHNVDNHTDLKFYFKVELNYTMDFDILGGGRLIKYQEVPLLIIAGKNYSGNYDYQIINFNDETFFYHKSCNQWISRSNFHTEWLRVSTDYVDTLNKYGIKENEIELYFNPSISKDKTSKVFEIFETAIYSSYPKYQSDFDLSVQLESFIKPEIKLDVTDTKPNSSDLVAVSLIEYIKSNTWLKADQIVVPNLNQFYLVSKQPLDNTNNNVNSYSNGDVTIYFLSISNPSNKHKWEKYIKLRDLYYQTINLSNLVEFNQTYDVFYNTYKELNSTFNKKLLSIDGHYGEIAGLEKKLGKNWLKSDVFSERFYLSDTDNISHLSQNAQAGFQYSINKYGKIDLDYIAQITQFKKNQLFDELDGFIFLLDKNIYVTKEILLNGNLKDREEALLRIDVGQLSAEDLKIYEASLQLVRKSIPPTIAFEDIGFRLGEKYIDPNIYTQFANHLFNCDNAFVDLSDSKEFLLRFDGEKPKAIFREFFVSSSENSRSYNGSELMCLFAMKSLYPSFKYTRTIDEKKVSFHDHVAETEARNIIDDMQLKFKEFLLENLSVEQKQQITKQYNYLLNSTIPNFGENAGEHLTFLDIDWKSAYDHKRIAEVKPHQKKAIWKMLQNNGGIVDHEVGLGKTIVLCILSHEMNRLNINKKNLILCMKANVNEIAETYNLLYPQDKLLYPSPKDVEKKNIESFINTIKNNHYDTIILSYEMFSKLPSSPTIEREFLEKEIEDLNQSILMAKEYDLSKREMRALQDNLASTSNRLESVIHHLNSNKLENYISFENLNIGHIIVDESHNFKNLTFKTAHKRVKGLGNPEGSQRATNLLLAIRCLQKKNNSDFGATFLSGTPISNSLTEMFLLFKYLRPQQMDRLGFDNFDSFAQSFCIKQSDYEVNVVGNITNVERFREFDKLPELAKLYSAITDYNTAENVGLDRPEHKTISVAIDPDSTMLKYLDYLKEFAETGKIKALGIEQKHINSKMLEATNMGRLVSMHPKLLNSSESSDCQTKISACADNVYTEYLDSNAYRGTQIIFSDIGTPKPEFNVYDEVKRLLIDKGIPENEIAFIHDSTTDAKKEKLFLDLNNGNIRILLGSSDKAGTGLNIQNRLIAIHNLDVPWTPKSLTQRLGRIKRQGNWACKEFRNNIAHNYVYGVKGSIDMFLYQLVSNKAKFIESARNYSGNNRKIDMGEFDEDAGLSYASFYAILSGDNSFMEKAKLEGKLKKTEYQLEALSKRKYKAKSDLSVFETKSSVFIKEINQFKNMFDELSSVIQFDKEHKPINQLSVHQFLPNKDSTVTDFGQALFQAYIHEPPLKELGKFYTFPIVFQDDLVGLQLKNGFFPVHFEDKLKEGKLSSSYFIGNSRIGLEIYKEIDKAISTRSEKLHFMEEKKPFLMQESNLDLSSLKESITQIKTDLSDILKKIQHNAQSSTKTIKID